MIVEAEKDTVWTHMEFMIQSKRSSDRTQTRLGDGKFRLGISRVGEGRKEVSSGLNYCQEFPWQEGGKGVCNHATEQKGTGRTWHRMKTSEPTAEATGESHGRHLGDKGPRLRGPGASGKFLASRLMSMRGQVAHPWLSLSNCFTKCWGFR